MAKTPLVSAHGKGLEKGRGGPGWVAAQQPLIIEKQLWNPTRENRIEWRGGGTGTLGQAASTDTRDVDTLDIKVREEKHDE